MTVPIEPYDLVIGTKGGDRLRLRFESFDVADASLKTVLEAMRRPDVLAVSVQDHTHVRVADISFACHLSALVVESK